MTIMALLFQPRAFALLLEISFTLIPVLELGDLNVNGELSCAFYFDLCSGDFVSALQCCYCCLYESKSLQEKKVNIHNFLKI